jgi:hypothetical protein
MNVLSDGWALVPEETGSLLRGELLKFANSVYTLGKGSLDPNSEWLVLGVLPLWACWQDGKMVDHKAAGPNQPLASRETLSRLDKSKWPRNKNGDPQDPWRNTRYLYLLNRETGAEATFTTETVGGRRAISDLSRAIKNKRKLEPDMCPVIVCKTIEWDVGYGPSLRPHFEIGDWIKSDGSFSLPEAPEPKPQNTASNVVEGGFSANGRGKTDRDFEESIPF